MYISDKNLDIEKSTEVNICFQLGTRLLSEYKHYFTLGSRNCVGSLISSLRMNSPREIPYLENVPVWKILEDDTTPK